MTNFPEISNGSGVARDHVVECWERPPDYQGMEILSPMVRASSLPLRLCALEYGAGLVYSGVQVDHRIIDSTRVEDPEFGCVDYVASDGSVTYKTCAEERGRNIFQLGTADASLAAKAATTVCQDVRGVDVNMGCTAPFSAQGSMGAALLERPEVAADILRTLRRELPPSCAVTCKIRMLPTPARTRDFMQLCERSGVDALAVHMRTADEVSDSHPAHWDEMRPLWDAVSVPVIANGDFLSRQHIKDFWLRVGSSEGGRGPAAIMVARGALWNPAIFHRDDSIQVPSHSDVVQRFIDTAIRVNSPHQYLKWVLTEMLNPGPCSPSVPFGGMQGRERKRLKNRLDQAKGMSSICQLFGVEYDSSRHPPNAHTLDYFARAGSVAAAVEPDWTPDRPSQALAESCACR